jgi:RimJ/RimL family protein N-acetyltransferase
MASYRKLLPGDARQLVRHLLALSPDERRLRFQGGVSDLTIERHGRRLDWFRAVVIGYFVDGRLRGAAELVFERSLCPREAELAVTVETPWQGRGVGTELTRRAITIARNRGAGRLTMLCLVENRPMRRIARKLDSALHFEGGAIEADLGLRRATPWTVFEELIQDGAGGLTAVTDGLLAPRPDAA